MLVIKCYYTDSENISTELAALPDNCTGEFMGHLDLEVNNPVWLVLSANVKVKFECSYKLLINYFHKSCVLNKIHYADSISRHLLFIDIGIKILIILN